MSFPRYDSYKDSGVEWLGEVPEHWGVTRFKWEIERNDGGVWGDDPDGENDTIVLRSTEQTVDGRWQIEDPAPRKLNAVEKASSLLNDGDLLVTKSSGSSLHIGKTTLVTPEIAELNCCYSNFMQRIRTKPSFLPKLAWHVMNNNLARLQFDLLSNSTTGLANLNGSLISQIILPIAPLSEQRSVAAFLDCETTKIDALIAEQQRLIELLKEKRQAVISHAVTKGLNPNAPMKDSGIEWLGEVPEHWEFFPLKKVVSTRKGVAFKADDFDSEGVRVDKASDIKNLTVRESEAYLPIEYLNQYSKAILTTGDIILSTVGSTPDVKNSAVGQLAKLPECLDGSLLNQNTVIFNVASFALDNEFLFLALQTRGYRDHLDLNAHGTANQASLNITDMLNFTIAIPGLNEQSEIADFLDCEIQEFQYLTTEAQRAIDLLKERRTALISAAVTGKIDVRAFNP